MGLVRRRMKAPRREAFIVEFDADQCALLYASMTGAGIRPRSESE